MSIQDLPKSLVSASMGILQEGEDYKQFFQKAMKKFGISSPSELKGDKEKEFYDYIDKNWKGKKEQVQVKVFYRGYMINEESVNYVFFSNAEANKFAAKIKSFVDSVDIEKMIAGHFNVKVSGDKKGLRKSTDVAIKMSEEVELVSEAKKGKYKSKKQSQIIREFEKIKKREKKEGFDVKDIDAVIKMFKKGIETEMYDDMEILTAKSLKLIDKHFMNMDTMVREELAAVIMKMDIDLYDMMFGY